MPQTKFVKCYFGCVVDGPLHRFPKPGWPREDRFNSWKAILQIADQERGDEYIYNNIKLCYRHFEPCYSLPSKLLTRNAIPTLNIASTSQQVELLPIPTTVNAPEPLTIMEVRAENNNGNASVQLMKKGKSPTLICKKTYILQSKEIEKLRKKLIKLEEKCKTQSSKIKTAEKLSRSKCFLQSIEKLPPMAATFIKLQMKPKKKPRGQKYSINEKIVALTIYKQSPKAYKLLKNMFTLPSKRTLQEILSHLTIKPGINKDMLNKLKESVSKMSPEKRLCTLLFDEVALSPGLYYIKSSDEIYGFEDNGAQKSKKIADHALVFMLKGIKGKFKQPILYTFCQSATKKEELKFLLKTIIKEINSIGLKIVATVCDQSAANIATIKRLKEDTKAKYLKENKIYKTNAIEFENIKIFPIFDTPHLLKGIRNNFLKKNLRYIKNGEVKIAKWEHLELLLKEDVGEDEIRFVNKLTEAHVNKDKIPKMKVKHAAQVFSQRVSSAMGFLAKRGILPTECTDTAELLLLFDKLFDSFNGHSYNKLDKKYKVCLKNGSPHFQLWDEVMPILKSMGFKILKMKKDGTQEVKYEKVPSINNFIHNINTFKEMWTYLNLEYDVKNVLTRNFNQDPLENFFCKIRNNGVRNTNPTCHQFTSAFKTLIINNFSTPHSISANCEDDDNKVLETLSSFLINKNENQIIEDPRHNLELDQVLEVINEVTNNEESIHNEAKNYVSGYILKKCRAKFCRNCKNCKNYLMGSKKNNEYISERDYTTNSLNYPSDNLKKMLSEIYSIVVSCLQKIPETQFLQQKVIFCVDMTCDFSTICCDRHKENITNFIKKIAFNIITHSWCTGVNRILHGNISVFDIKDNVKMHAFNYYKKHKSKK